MFMLWYFSCVFWLLLAILIGHAVHSGWIGVAIFVAAFIVQTWISRIAYLIEVYEEDIDKYYLIKVDDIEKIEYDKDEWEED